MENIKIIDPSNEDIYGCLGINEQRYQQIVSHLQISYNNWNKQSTNSHASLLLHCCEICNNINERAFTSFQIGQAVCRINYAQKKTLDEVWNDYFFVVLGITKDRSGVLINNFNKEAELWGRSESSDYTTLLQASCLICQTINEISFVAFMLGFIKYKFQIVAGEV